MFYHRFLRCFVLLDLKIGEVKHQDLGQMQMYVNYYDRFVKSDGENATIGIILCKKKNDTLVEITLPHLLGILGGKDSAALATVTFKIPCFQSFLTYTGELIYQEND